MFEHTNQVQERYRILFSGGIRDNFAPEKVQEELAVLFGKDKADIVPLFNGRCRIIKNNLDWNSVNRYDKVLREKGVLTEVQVVMDAKTLKEAIVFPQSSAEMQKKYPVPKAEKPSCPPATLEDSFLLNFDRSRVAPLLFYPCHNEPLKNEAGKTVACLSTLTPTVSWLSGLLVAFGIGYFSEIKFAQYYAEQMSTGGYGTLLSLLIFFLCVFFLPTIIIPAKKLRLSRVRGGDAILECRQVDKYHPLQRTYLFTDAADKPICTIYREIISRRCICASADGERKILLSAEMESDLDEAALTTADLIRKGLKLDNQYIDFLLKPISGGEKVTRYVLRDEKGIAVGHFQPGHLCALTLYREKNSHTHRTAAYAVMIYLTAR